MTDFKRVGMFIGIAVVLGIFTGFLSFQIGDGVEQACLKETTQDYICCTDIPRQGEPEFKFYQKVPADKCTGVNQVIVENSFCEEAKVRAFSQECENKQQTYAALVALIVGVIAIFIGMMITQVGVVSGGLIGGGIISLIISLVIFWSRLEGWIRVVIAFVILITLIVLAWFKLKDDD